MVCREKHNCSLKGENWSQLLAVWAKLYLKIMWADYFENWVFDSAENMIKPPPQAKSKISFIFQQFT